MTTNINYKSNKYEQSYRDWMQRQDENDHQKYRTLLLPENEKNMQPKGMDLPNYDV
ncbi:MAG: hypothetical protein H7069_13015 [Phormidesmis sp. FL-bin-119]|nr:hypothetical protein [Pedobacter sp.]